MSRITALFLNSPRAQCSIHESGKMVFDALRDSQHFDWDYVDLDQTFVSSRRSYGLAVFNYHPGTMPWLNLAQIQGLRCFTATMILETLPGSAFPMCPRDVFHVHLAIDPTIPEVAGHTYALPRPLASLRPPIDAGPLPDVPRIGTFGFGTPGKGFERVVDAVNREFDRAIIRINLPSADFADSTHAALHGVPYVQYLIDLMRRVAKPGVEIEATHHFFTQTQLIDWCRENDINVFLYDRQQSGLSATTDQAIASGRPLLVGDNPTFRHVHSYMHPYPFWSIREAMQHGSRAIARIQRDWNQDVFRERFEQSILAAARHQGRSLAAQHPVRVQPSAATTAQQSRIFREVSRVRDQILRVVRRRRSARRLAAAPFVGRPSEPLASDTRVDLLFVNHPEQQCGVHQYGRNVANQLQAIPGLRLAYREASTAKQFFSERSAVAPRAVIFNHYPATMGWLTPEVSAKVTEPRLGFLHEMTQQAVDDATSDLFDWHLISDPTIRTSRPDVFLSPRLLPDFCNYQPLPTTPTFGSFGFGIANKGFEDVVDRIQAEYDEARIILRMPFNDVVDPRGMHHALATAQRCRQRLRKPGITLDIHHDFLATPDLLQFLAANTANIFLYDESLHRGISSVLEFAIAARRPLVINDCAMFRHVSSHAPSISIRKRPIRAIVADGVAPLVPLYNEWSAAMFRKRWADFLFGSVFGSIAHDSPPVRAA
jgi:hypothetical protein